MHNLTTLIELGFLVPSALFLAWSARRIIRALTRRARCGARRSDRAPGAADSAA